MTHLIIKSPTGLRILAKARLGVVGSVDVIILGFAFFIPFQKICQTNRILPMVSPFLQPYYLIFYPLSYRIRY